MTAETAKAVYDVLVETCSASENWRENFVHRQASEIASEHRIIGGILGMGGKFRRNVGFRGYGDGTWGEIWYVDVYPEDMDDERRAVIDRLDERLDAIRVEHSKNHG